MPSRSQDSQEDDQVTLIANDSLISPKVFSPHQSYDSTERPPPPGASAWTWTLVCVPVIAHFLLSAGLTAAMWIYVNDRLFNIDHRRAQYTEIDGTQTTLPHATLLQTDITTLLSIILSIIRSLGGTWFAGVCWRCAFILLEKDGMRLKDFNEMVSKSFPGMFMFRSRRKNSHTHITLYTAIVLLLALPAQYAAPILSGSITWVPAIDMTAGSVPVSGIPTTEFGPGRNSWAWYSQYPGNRVICRTRAAALAGIAWSTSDSNNATTGVMKRIVPSARSLVVNSTLANVTLPFFAVHSLTWLSAADLNATTEPDLVTALKPGGGLTNVSSNDNPLQTVAPTLGIIPTTPYTEPWNSTIHDWNFPSPSKFIAETGLLAVFAYRQDNTTNCTKSSDSFGVLPPNVGFRSFLWLINGGLANTTNCYIFANVTYSAGVVACPNCVISASGGVFERNISELAPSLIHGSPSDGNTFLKELQPDAMTQQAITMMPEVIATMANMNVSLPPTWYNLDTYAREMLTRSYAASWNVLTDTVSSSFITPWSEIAIPPSASNQAADSNGPDTGATTRVSIAIPAIRAVVSLWRVVLWFGIQSLLSFSGLLFIILQATAMKPLVQKPAVEVFLFDTGEVRRRIGFEAVRDDDDAGDEYSYGKTWESTGKVTQRVTVKRVEEFEDEDDSLMRLTKEDDYHVIRYYR